MTELRLTGFLICRCLDEADRVSHLVAGHLAAARIRPGCLSFEIYRSSADPCRFALAGAFRDEAAYEAYRTATRDTLWARTTGAIPSDLKLTRARA